MLQHSAHPISTVPEADICLILEGTYPFVTGGVSSWVHDLISSMPDVTFALLHISASSGINQQPRYPVPANVVSFAECFVHDPLVHADRCRMWTPGNAQRMWRAIKAFHQEAFEKKVLPFIQLLQGYAVPQTRILNTRDLLLSRRSWRYLVDAYQRRNPAGSFIDFFWTWRAIHLPIFQTLNAEIPPAKLYHLISTGYAGLAGIAAKLRTGAPLVLTEHGIYVKERQIEISRADWIYTEPEKIVTVKTSPGVLKEMWINNFITLGRLCYEQCDQIITLYGGNQQLQQEFGAPRHKQRIIPNGVKTEIFAPLRHLPRPTDGIRRVGFVGRVVPIKDVKCFIKACKLCADQLANVQFLILGPTDEDPEYFNECQSLVELLGMPDKITFTGAVNVREYYPLLDVFVLTSISEGQPLTILEAMCAGVPTVATNVGACAELVLGRTEDDQALGPSGMITNIGQPAETGAALVKLLSQESLRGQMIQSGFKRIEAFYRQDKVIADYRVLYEHWIGQNNNFCQTRSS
jgi:glycosyltransferase involved in cell wall biosynthesis